MNTKTLSFFFLISSLTLLFNSLYVFSASDSNSISLLLNCGSDTAETDYEGRKWEPDSKYLGKPDNSVTSPASFQDPSLPSNTPYMTARFFQSPSSYSIKVPTNTRLWLRLHFYPSTYGNFNPTDTFLEAHVNGLTLLKNFSASITALALTQAYIFREFTLPPVSIGNLNLTFFPSPQHNGSYAFVNGIEVISMPDLFKSQATMVGFSNQIQTIDLSSSTMQTMYRLNVAGQYIAATNDSGLTRAWYDDTPYIFGAGIGVTTRTLKDIKYSTDVPETVAPPDVYGSFRAMGPDGHANINYNLTWVFQVDTNFTYVVRLHFCELLDNKLNQRVFDIYVNNQTAEIGADIMVWSGGQYVPYYKDYAVTVDDGPGDENLWVALHPNSASKPEYYDALLNGMEVFKLNDSTGNLAGPNPVPSAMLLENESEEYKTFAPPKSNNKQIIGGAAGGAAAVGLMAAICIAVYQRKKRILGNDSGSSGWLPLYGGSYRSTSKSTISGKSCGSSTLSTLAAGLCRHFSLSEIKHGTKNFDESHVIGVGGFGKVYKGVVDGGTKVAIKRANPSSEQGVHEFRTEIEMLSKLRHRHLVSLIGFCEENDEMILVYDYMAHGTLREHLYKGNKTHLSWKQRLEICIGAARGLHYLHTGAKYTIIHRDVKTTNILVDENWVAKVSDFGLSKTGPALNQTHVSTVVKGSFGYLDPEYFRRQQLTDKSDVYSFGVVLFEVLCARPALNPSLSKEQVSLADWALHCQKKGILEDIIDPHLKGKIIPECLKKFAETAEKCLSDHGLDRPSMGDVLWNLEFALQLQENAGSTKLLEDGQTRKPSEVAAHEATLSLHDLSLAEAENSEDASSPFSMMVKQEGR